MLLIRCLSGSGGSCARCPGLRPPIQNRSFTEGSVAHPVHFRLWRLLGQMSKFPPPLQNRPFSKETAAHPVHFRVWRLLGQMSGSPTPPSRTALFLKGVLLIRCISGSGGSWARCPSFHPPSRTARVLKRLLLIRCISGSGGPWARHSDMNS